MSCESNAKDLTLAREYKYLLSKIRPLIEQLDKSKDAQLCLLWLSKLDQCSRWEECERNEILCELSRQVKNKSLEPPFNSQPPPGPLKNVVLHVRNLDYAKESKSLSFSREIKSLNVFSETKNSIPLWKSNDFSDDISSEMATEASPRSPVSSFSMYSCGSDECHSYLIPWREKPAERTLNTAKATKEDHSRCIALQQKYHERLANDQMLITRYHEIIKSLITQKFKNPATMKLKSLRSSYESKICHLTTSLKMTEEENSCLRKKLLSCAGPGEKLQETQSRIAELHDQIRRLELENNALDTKCRELETEKDTCLSHMVERLKESEKKLRESDDFIKAMEKKYEENFWTCKTQHEQEKREIENKYTCELSALERILEEKQSEIGRLVEQISTQSLHFEEQALRLKHELLENHELDKEKRKVKFLKSKLKRLNKNQESMALAFHSQLEQLVSKKDFLISILEMKVKSSDVDTSGNCLYPGFDDVMSEKVRILEMQYRMLLEEAENQAAERRQLDLQKILILEKQLVDNGVGVQELSPASVNENTPLTESNKNEELIDHELDN